MIAVIEVPIHFVCALVPAADVNAIVAFAFTRIDFVAAALGLPDL